MRLLLTLTLATLLFVPTLAHAQTGPATRYVQQQNERVNHLLERHCTTDAERAARDAEIAPIVVGLLDFDELSRRSLDANWTTITAAQQAEFSSILRQLVERQYRTNLERIRDYQLDYTREETTASGVVVHMTAQSRTSHREPPVVMAYSMHMVGTEWRVFDVVTDGVSLVHNYQQQFRRIITRDGFDALLTRMRDRLAHESGIPGTSTTPHTGGSASH